MERLVEIIAGGTVLTGVLICLSQVFLSGLPLA